MTVTWRSAAAVVAVLVGGCAKRLIKPPTEAWVTLGGLKASYRSWAGTDVCLQDAAVFGGDLDSMSALLTDFLAKTNDGPDGPWPEERLALLEEAQRVLPVALDLEAKALFTAERASCPFTGLPAARALNDRAKERLAEGPELLALVRAKKAQAAWRAGHGPAQQAAKDKACAEPAAPGAKPVAYHAFEDTKGRTEWLFCDGAKVVASPGNPPAHEPGPAPPPVDPPAKGKKKAKKPPRPPEAKDYTDAALAFPGAQVSREPRLPGKKAKVREDGPEPADAPEG